MARIRSSTRNGATLVIVAGRLSAADMRRLEQACAPGLMADPAPLEINLEDVTEVDATAAAMLVRMRDRGARMWGGPSDPTTVRRLEDTGEPRNEFMEEDRMGRSDELAGKPIVNGNTGERPEQPGATPATAARSDTSQAPSLAREATSPAHPVPEPPIEPRR
jgi:hypothetical protein